MLFASFKFQNIPPECIKLHIFNRKITKFSGVGARPPPLGASILVPSVRSPPVRTSATSTLLSSCCQLGQLFAAYWRKAVWRNSDTQLTSGECGSNTTRSGGLSCLGLWRISHPVRIWWVRSWKWENRVTKFHIFWIKSANKLGKSQKNL